MHYDNFVREQLAFEFMKLLPESINSQFLSDKKLVEELGISINKLIVFPEDNVSFSSDILIGAIRSSFLEPIAEFELSDNDGRLWKISSILGEAAVFTLNWENIEIKNDRYWPLIPKIENRLKIFEIYSKIAVYSSEEVRDWVSILSEPLVSDEHVSDLVADMDCCPAHIEELLRIEFSGSSNNVTTLAPDKIRYYSRLIGSYTGSKNIDDYCSNELRYFFSKRADRNININDFLICSHSSISMAIAEYLIDPDEFQKIVDQAIQLGHPILLIACFEVGVRKFLKSNSSEIETLYRRLSSTEVLDHLSLFCSMTVFVDGELARLQIFKDCPPFYRRLASLSQAGLILKVALQEGIAFGKVEQWASQQRGLFFYCQSFVDLRHEHRWLPSYLTAEQLINELYGRISNICHSVDENDVLKAIIEDLSVEKKLNLNAFLPGPLEGNSTPSKIPGQLSKLFWKKVEKEPTPESFTVLINSAPFWKIDEEYLDRIVTLLEGAQHQLRSVHDKDSVYQILTGLAHVSCMTRSTKLAASLFVLSRIYRDFLEVDSDPQNYLALGIVAAAAYGDLEGWADYIGRWCTELVYLQISENSILNIQSMLERLCIQEPYLFYTCSKALDILRLLSSK